MNKSWWGILWNRAVLFAMAFTTCAMLAGVARADSKEDAANAEKAAATAKEAEDKAKAAEKLAEDTAKAAEKGGGDGQEGRRSRQG